MSSSQKTKPSFTWPEDKQVAHHLRHLYAKARKSLKVNNSKNAQDGPDTARRQLWPVVWDHRNYDPTTTEVLKTARNRFRDRGWAIYWRTPSPQKHPSVEWGCYVELNDQRTGIPKNLIEQDLINAVFENAIASKQQSDMWENIESTIWVNRKWEQYKNAVELCFEHDIVVEPQELMIYDMNSVEYIHGVYHHLDAIIKSELYERAF